MTAISPKVLKPAKWRVSSSQDYKVPGWFPRSSAIWPLRKTSRRHCSQQSWPEAAEAFSELTVRSHCSNTHVHIVVDRYIMYVHSIISVIDKRLSSWPRC